MKVFIEQSNPSGTVHAPPSKSMAHRMLILAGLTSGVSEIGNLAFSDDVQATLSCLKRLGVQVETVAPDRIRVKGLQPNEFLPASELDCRECGSTLRFLIPLCMLSGETATLTGSERLMQRPLDVYADVANDQNLLFLRSEGSVKVRGPLRPGTFRLPGDVSSQFVSGLLFVLPLLSGDSRMVLTGKIESGPYIAMTLDAIRSFGGVVRRVSDNEFLIPGNQHYHPIQADIEGDWSNAAFFLALRELGFNVAVTGLLRDSRQGDKACVRHFHTLSSAGGTIDLADTPDLGPVEFMYAALKHGGSFTGTKRLRIKESDRVAAMQEELRKCGIIMETAENRVTISSPCATRSEVPLSGHNDHRIVMALSLLCILFGGTIDGAEAVHKSFPDYFEILKELKVKLRYEAG